MAKAKTSAVQVRKSQVARMEMLREEHNEELTEEQEVSKNDFVDKIIALGLEAWEAQEEGGNEVTEAEVEQGSEDELPDV